MKAWHFPLLLAEGAIAVAVTLFSGDMETQQGVVAGTSNATLIMRDDDGKNPRAHLVRPGAEVTLDGQRANLRDFHAGDAVTVTLENEDGISVVKSISAQSGPGRLSQREPSDNDATGAGPSPSQHSTGARDVLVQRVF